MPCKVAVDPISLLLGRSRGVDERNSGGVVVLASSISGDGHAIESVHVELDLAHVPAGSHNGVADAQLDSVRVAHGHVGGDDDREVELDLA
jgi:hypothetical protein